MRSWVCFVRYRLEQSSAVTIHVGSELYPPTPAFRIFTQYVLNKKVPCDMVLALVMLLTCFIVLSCVFRPLVNYISSVRTDFLLVGCLCPGSIHLVYLCI